jgi:hypothetical protein
MAMSQLFINFKSKSADEALQSNPKKMYLGYPIAIVPIKHWAIEKTDINVVTRKIIELVKLGIQSPKEISALLGVPENLQKVIQYEWIELEQKGILFVEDGRFRVKNIEDAVISEEYKDGYLIYDKIRGVFFPYIHKGDYYLTSEKRMKTSVVSLHSNVNVHKNLYKSEKFLASARNSVRIYGQSKKQEIITGEVNFDLPKEQEESTMEEDQQSYRIELKPYDFVQQGYMVVTFEGDVHYNDSGAEWAYVRAISPFSGQESKMFYSIISAQEEGYIEVELFHDVLMEEDYRSLEREFLMDEGIDVDIYDRLYESIAEELGEIKISQAVMELLEAVEKEYIKLTLGMEEFVGNRPSQLNNWNLVLEALLDEFMEKQQYERFHALPKWDTLKSEYDCKIHLKNRLIDVWDFIPYKIKNNMVNKLKFVRRNKRITDSRMNGCRDRIASILLCELVAKEQRKEPTRFLDKITQDPSILASIDAVSEARNSAGGHYDSELVLQPKKDFIKQLGELRKNVYQFIRNILGEELA